MSVEKGILCSDKLAAVWNNVSSASLSSWTFLSANGIKPLHVAKGSQFVLPAVHQNPPAGCRFFLFEFFFFSCSLFSLSVSRIQWCNPCSYLPAALLMLACLLSLTGLLSNLLILYFQTNPTHSHSSWFPLFHSLCRAS